MKTFNLNELSSEQKSFINDGGRLMLVKLNNEIDSEKNWQILVINKFGLLSVLPSKTDGYASMEAAYNNADTLQFLSEDSPMVSIYNIIEHAA